MFWRKHRSRKPGLTGTGDFIWNIDWWLWDDRASPGLISIERLSELADAGLPDKERKQFSVSLIRSTMAGADQRNLKFYFEKMNDYLTNLRDNNFEQLGHWVESNFLAGQQNSITRNSAGAIEYDLTRVLSAYLNCLNRWEFGYDWKEISDHRGAPSLLIYKHGEPRYCLDRNELQYVQGKPYRFEVMLKSGVVWRFEDQIGHFEINVPGYPEEIRF